MTSEVIRPAFSDVCVVLPLSSIWLFAAFCCLFFSYECEEEKVVSDNRYWCSVKKLAE